MVLAAVTILLHRNAVDVMEMYPLCLRCWRSSYDVTSPVAALKWIRDLFIPSRPLTGKIQTWLNNFFVGVTKPSDEPGRGEVAAGAVTVR